MKRYICFICAMLLVLSLWGCHGEEPSGVHFYYLRSDDTISYGEADALIAPMEISAEGLDTQALFQLYLEGPDSEILRSPLPANIRLLSLSQRPDALMLEFTSGFNSLGEIQMTLAMACLCATAYEITGLETLEVRAGEQNYTFQYDSFLFLDSVEPTE